MKSTLEIYLRYENPFIEKETKVLLMHKPARPYQQPQAEQSGDSSIFRLETSELTAIAWMLNCPHIISMLDTTTSNRFYIRNDFPFSLSALIMPTKRRINYEVVVETTDTKIIQNLSSCLFATKISSKREPVSFETIKNTHIDVAIDCSFVYVIIL